MSVVEEVDNLWSVQEDEGEAITYVDSFGNEVTERMAPMPPRSHNVAKYDGPSVVRGTSVLERFTGTEQRRSKSTSDGLGSAFVDAEVGATNSKVPINVHQSNAQRLSSMIARNHAGVQPTSDNEQMVDRNDLYDGYNIKRHILRPRYRKPTNRENMQAVVFGPENLTRNVKVGIVRSGTEHVRKAGSVEERKSASYISDGTAATGGNHAPVVNTAKWDGMHTLAQPHGAYIGISAPATAVSSSASSIAQAASRVRRDIALPKSTTARARSQKDNSGSSASTRPAPLLNRNDSAIARPPTVTVTKGELRRIDATHVLGTSDATEVSFSHPDRRRRTHDMFFGHTVVPQKRISNKGKHASLSSAVHRRKDLQLDGIAAHDAVFRAVHPAIAESSTSARRSNRGTMHSHGFQRTDNLHDGTLLAPVRVQSRSKLEAHNQKYSTTDSERRWTSVSRSIVESARRVWSAASRSAAAVIDDTVRSRVDDGRTSSAFARKNSADNHAAGAMFTNVPKHMRLRASTTSSANSNLESAFDVQTKRARLVVQSLDTFAAVRSTIGRLVHRHLGHLNVLSPMRTELATSINIPVGRRDRRLPNEEGTECRPPMRGGVSVLPELHDSNTLCNTRQKQMDEEDDAAIALSQVRPTFQHAPSVTPALHGVG